MAHKIFVGLSGGVDSAVSAALLKEQGFDVVGVFIKIWQPEFIECTWKEDRLDAMRVAAVLGIPFREVDLSAEYKKDVVDSMVRDYARGITPNPDVLCNQHIKFGAFMDWARGEGATAIATGHYAQTKEESGHFELLRARDVSKDQSYFLYRLRRSDLSRVFFPVGGMLKSEVRAHARRLRLPVAQKPDSQGLCFVGEVRVAEFLSRFIPLSRGTVVSVRGAVVGTHDGAALYTIGQRHGFSVVPDTAAGSGPFFVVDIDAVSNTIRVSSDRRDAMHSEARLDAVHWIGRMPSLPCVVLAQMRYHEPPVKVTLSHVGESIVAIFDEPRIASPGQSMVLYDGDTCLGGGTIEKDVSLRMHSNSIGASSREVQ